MEKEKLINIIENLKEVRTETKSKVSDEVLFDAGCRIYTSEQISHRQDTKGSRLLNTSFQSPSPATTNQLSFLKKLNYKGETPKTSKEASDLIDRIKGGSSKANKENFNKTYGK
jgi:hypothetical protein